MPTLSRNLLQISKLATQTEFTRVKFRISLFESLNFKAWCAKFKRSSNFTTVSILTAHVEYEILMKKSSFVVRKFVSKVAGSSLILEEQNSTGQLFHF